MTTSNLNIRIDNELRSQATQIFESYGLSPSQAIKLFFNQVVVTHKIPLNFEYQQQENTLTPLAEARLKQSAQEIENGEYTDYHSVDELLQGITEIAHA